jgi:glycosyltransferase involved in cell wall biosynthesis
MRTRAEPGRILFVSHDARRTGAPTVLLQLLRFVSAHTALEFDVLLKEAAGALAPEMRALGKTWTLRRFDLVQALADGDGLLATSARRLGADRLVGSMASARRRVAGRHDRRLLELLRRRGVALVYLNTMTTGDVLTALAGFAGPVICHVHELAHLVRTRVPRGDLESLLARTTLFLAPSRSVVDGLTSDFGVPADRVELVPSFISARDWRADAVAAAEVRERLGIPAGAPVVGSCGTLDARKGPDLFVRLARAVRAGGALDAHFVWVGGKTTGSRGAELARQVRREGLAGSVHFVGEIADPRAHFGAMDVFASTSREDPFPLVCLQAAALGKPVVCFSGSGGAAELVEDDSGFVVPHLDVGAMGARVSDLLRSPALRDRLGESGCRKVTSRYDVEVVAPRIVRILDRELARAASAGHAW